MRNKLPNRREGYQVKIVHESRDMRTTEFLVTFNIDDEWTIREVFCANPNDGSDIYALITDGCILLSIYLQTGGEIEKLVKTLGEDRAEGQPSGPPSSLFGAIAKEALSLQKELNNKRDVQTEGTRG